jgi:Rieske Fe-S protein
MCLGKARGEDDEMTESEMIVRAAPADDRPDDGPEVQRATSRRSVLLGAGALGAAGILAACGDDSAPSSSPSTTGASTATAPGQTEAPAEPDLTTAQVPVGGGVILTNKNVIVTQPTEGEFLAFAATCTHMQCQLSSILGDKITCDCHGSQFSIADGSVARGPATRPLPPRGVTVDGDSLILG